MVTRSRPHDRRPGPADRAQREQRKRRLLARLARAPLGRSRTQVYTDVFRNAPRKGELDALIGELAGAGLVSVENARRKFVVYREVVLIKVMARGEENLRE